MRQLGTRSYVLAACLVLSGASSLIYEVCWIREAGLVFGVTLFAASSVFAIFFLGLAIGSYLFGLIGQRTSYPLRWYCLLEFCLAAMGLASLWAFDAADIAYGWFYRMKSGGQSLSLIGSLCVISLALLPPTILMGGTLPLYCRQFVDSKGRITNAVGWLYALNTLGAVAGCAAAGLWLIPVWGVSSSIRCAAALSLTASLVAAAVAWNTRAPELSRSAPAARDRTKLAAAVSAMFFGSGFVAMAGEILWMRYFSLLVHNTVYTYSLTLTIVLLGIVIGSALVAMTAKRVTAPLFVFGLTQVASGVWVSVVMLLPASWWHGRGQFAVWIYLLLLLPPAIFSGAAFPLAIRAVLTDPRQASVRVGFMVAVNTLGGIVGAVSMGFVLLPLLGMHRSLWMTTGVSVVVGVWAWLISAGWMRWSSVAWAAGGVLTWLAVHTASQTRLPADFLGSSGDLVHVIEGRNSNVAVLRSSDAVRMEIDRWWQGEDRVNHQIMAAHIPSILRPAAERVLVVGVGVGQTASRFLLHDIKRLDCVDIEPAVFDVVRTHFDAEWMMNPAVRPIADDGRALLTHSRETYDLISLELGQISRPGVASFYTSEFYERARQRLNAGGLLCQFVPTPFFTVDELRSVMGTFVDVFPESTLWYNTSELLLIGCGDGEQRISVETLRQQLSRPAVHEDLRYSQWGGPQHWLNQPENLLGSFLLGPRQLKALGNGARRLSSDHPTLEYATSGRELRTTSEIAIVDLLTESLAPLSRIVAAPLERELQQAGESIRRKNLGDMLAVPALRQVERLKASGDFLRIVSLLEAPLRENPDHVKANRIAADALVLLGQLAEAENRYEKALETDANDALSHRGLGFCLHRQQRLPDAIAHYRKAAALQSADAELHNNWGAALAQSGKIAEAVEHFREALELQPGNKDAHRNLAQAMQVLGQ